MRGKKEIGGVKGALRKRWMSTRVKGEVGS